MHLFKILFLNVFVNFEDHSLEDFFNQRLEQITAEFDKKLTDKTEQCKSLQERIRIDHIFIESQAQEREQEHTKHTTDLISLETKMNQHRLEYSTNINSLENKVF